MPLSEYQVDWIGRIRRSPVTQEDVDKADERIKKRETYLKDTMGKVLGDKRNEIDEAQKDLMVRHKVNLDTVLLSIDLVVETPWRAKDSDRDTNRVRADSEVDTKEDVRTILDKNGEVFATVLEIPQGDLDKLTQAYASLNELQLHMASQLDEDGNRLFTDDDIRRELWTPIVRDGLVPDNMVPDKYSEEALAFSGGKQIYEEKLKDYTKKTTGREGLLDKLGLAKDVVSLVTTGAGSFATMINANEVAKLQQQLLDPSTSSAQASDLRNQILLLQAPTNTINSAGAIVGGGIGIVETWVANEGNSGNDKQWWAKAGEATAGILIDMVGKATTAGISFAGTSSGPQANIVSNSVMTGLNSLRVGFSIAQVALEKDPEKRKRLLEQIGTRIADVVGNAFNIAANTYLNAANKLSGPNATVEQKEMAAALKLEAGQLGQISVAVTTGIKAMAKGPQVFEMISNGRYKEAALLLGGGVIQTVLSGTSEIIVDELREDVSKEEFHGMSTAERLYAQVGTKDIEEKHKDIKVLENGTEITRKETDEEMQTRVQRERNTERMGFDTREDTASTTLIGDIDKAMVGLNKTLLKDLKEKPKLVLPDSIADMINKEMEEATLEAKQEQVKKELEEAFTPEIIDKMFEEFGTKLKGYENLYSDAHPVPDLDGAPNTKVEEAIDAINRAMERTSELRARADLINGVTSATAGVVAAIFPGTGAVVAAQQIAFDIFMLVQLVEKHNAWVKSMEIAFRSNSAYSSGVEKLMTNAQIALSKTAVKLVLHSLGLGAQVGRCFDPTGGATIAAAALTLTEALVDFGYKMRDRREISTAWEAYRDALDNPGNRKRARKAMRLNSTLAKCAVAYGACIVGDPVAKEAIRRTGLTPEVLADDKDVCKKLVSYLENEMNTDPSVLNVDKKARPWLPDDRVHLTPVSWLQFKQAAHRTATPRLAKASLASPAVDKALAALSNHWGGAESYKQAMVDMDILKQPNADKLITDFATKSVTCLDALVTALTAYAPMQEESPGSPHLEFTDIAKTLMAVAKLNKAMAEEDVNARGSGFAQN